MTEFANPIYWPAFALMIVACAALTFMRSGWCIFYSLATIAYAIIFLR